MENNHNIMNSCHHTFYQSLGVSLYRFEVNWSEEVFIRCNISFNLHVLRSDEQSDGSELSVLIDQKTYLEEVNRNLR